MKTEYRNYRVIKFRLKDIDHWDIYLEDNGDTYGNCWQMLLTKSKLTNSKLDYKIIITNQ